MQHDAEIISALKLGDPSALASLYDKYGATFYGAVLRIVQSEEKAEEIVQETFLKIWKSATSFDGTKGNFFTWALNIARNTAIDSVRSSDFRSSQKTDPFDFLAYSQNHPSEETATDHIGLPEIVGKLAGKYRTVIDLAYFQGYTQSEIEEEMNVPIGTVKTRLRLVIRELRKIFTKQAGSSGNH